MGNWQRVELRDVEQHELKTGANSRLGSYGMSDVCPVNEFECFKGAFEVDDLERLFLLGMFAKHTRDHSGRLRDVLESMSENDRVGSFFDAKVDVATRPELAVVAVTDDLYRGSLTLIDGNHRSISQFLRQRTIEGVPAFVCVHPQIRRWGFLPALARANSSRT